MLQVAGVGVEPIKGVLDEQKHGPLVMPRCLSLDDLLRTLSRVL